jgi:small nuclear ribonucleoprotein (snRNP)-like protein
MTFLTRSQGIAAFVHIMDNVLGRPILKTALEAEGIQDIYALLTIDEGLIDGLVYSDEEGTTTTPLPRGDKNLIRVFLGYCQYRSAIGDPIHDWTLVTEEGFNEFRLNPAAIQAGIALPTGIINNVPGGSGTPSSASKPSLADSFRRGIKRDPSLFPELKDERHNDAWHRSFMTQARAQGVDDALDEAYVPSTDEEKDLFQEKQKYLYAVLEGKVKTDRGKLIVRKYDQTYDARAVYLELSEHHTKSTKAAMSAAALLSYITSERLGTGNWKGTTEGFITHWQEQVRQYERQVPLSDHFSDGQKRTMLENAVRDVDELRQVKVKADLERTMTGKVLTYDQYAALLLSTAVGYDTNRAGGGNRSRGKHVVYQHELEPDPHDDDDPDELFDIDYPVEQLNVNVHRRSPAPQTDQRVRLPFDRWSKLSDTAKKTWDALDDQAKSIILGTNMPQGVKPQQPRMPPHNKGPQRRVNLHDMSAYDLLHAFVAQSIDEEDPQPGQAFDGTPIKEEPVDDPSPTAESSLLINAAK